MYSGLPILSIGNTMHLDLIKLLNGKRMDLANDFYASKKIEDQGIKLEEIQKLSIFPMYLLKEIS